MSHPTQSNKILNMNTELLGCHHAQNYSPLVNNKKDVLLPGVPNPAYLNQAARANVSSFAFTLMLLYLPHQRYTTFVSYYFVFRPTLSEL